jgi:hypothetical protein
VPPLACNLQSHDSRIFCLLLMPRPSFGSPRNISNTYKTLFGMRRRYELNIPTGGGGGGRGCLRWPLHGGVGSSLIVHTPLLHSLVPNAKLIQVSRTATKHANVNFLTWIWSSFLYTSLGDEGWLGIGWVVVFGWFE